MPNIRVGILHSLSQTMAISELPLVEAALMAIAEINQAGGVLGNQIEPIIADGASDPREFEVKARKLIEQDQVATVFGCWTSLSRKAVLPIFEQHNALLWYPVQYEGLEQSKNIFYTGACLNQQVEPAVDWLLQNQRDRFYLIGSDYVFPRTANQVLKGQLRRQAGILAGEEYSPLGTHDFADAIARIQQVQPNVVFNTLNGDSNLAFYRQYAEAGITAAQIPIMAVSVSEVELTQIGLAAAGHYACWCYFQNVDMPKNRSFVQNFQHRYGADRVTNDPMATAYSQIYLWQQAVESAQSFAVDPVRNAAYGQTFESPCGTIKIESNHHVARGYRIGRALPCGQFEIIYSSDRQIKPLPWLGAEEANFANSALIIDLLAQFPKGLQDRWQLEAVINQLRTETEERHQVETELRSANAEVQALFASMDQLIFVYDRFGKHLKIPSENPRLQYKPDQTRLGKTLHDVFPKATADMFLGYIQKALETGETINPEYKMILGGQEIWSDAGISPIDDNSVVWVVRDITKRKHLEESLVQANAEISTLNDRLKSDNLRMSAELEITRRLQKMILPKDEELQNIEGLDIAGFMEPAAEVGGDYYDVLQHEGKVKIGIGDVTGHGLESGVVMIMAQTAVRTLLANNETNPIKFLDALNLAIYGNTHRMESLKNMSLALLDYEAGTIRLSGQHEEMIVVRHNGEIELFDTLDLGFPLGLELDITPFVAEIEIKLRPGDVAVLYTDGITEAVNDRNEQYGLDHMYAVLKQNVHKPASGIRQAVIDNVMQHIGKQKIYDDITLLILKQK